MKTYTFYYYDNPVDFKSDNKEEFIYSSSRFSVAFEAFLTFIIRSDFNYFIFVNFYRVCRRQKKAQLRVLPSNCHISLDRLQVMNYD